MSLLLGNFNNNKSLSVIKDPFLKDKVTDITIRYTSWSNKFYWYAKIQFKNGNTSGEQITPDCDTFEEVLAQIKIIEQSIK